MSPQRYYEVVEDRPAPGPPLAVRLGVSWLTNALVLAIVAGLLSGVTVKNIAKRLDEGDPWSGMSRHARALPKR